MRHLAPGDVVGTAFSWIVLAVSVAVKENMAFIGLCLVLLSTAVTIFNGYLTSRKTRIEIQRLLKQQAESEES